MDKDELVIREVSSDQLYEIFTLESESKLFCVIFFY